MYYATIDSDGTRIAQDADISAFKTEEEARAYLLGTYAHPMNNWDLDSAVIEAGDFSDCWIKTIEEPKAHMVEPFTLDNVIVQRPGQHPGGNMFWTTPRAEVLVVSLIHEKEEG